MRLLQPRWISLPLLAAFVFLGCSSSGYVKKTNKERYSMYQAKLSDLRSEDVSILKELDTILSKADLLLQRAGTTKLDDSDEVTLLLDAAESVLVEANTRRLYVTQKRAYVISEQAYNERASRIQTLRDQYEKQLPAQKKEVTQ